MRFITVEQWRKAYFPEGSRPPTITARRWIRSGKVPGRKIGGTWFVDEHAFLADGNELVEKALAG